MSSTHTALHYHVIFSTKHRQPLLDADWRPRLHEYLGGSVRNLGAHPRGIGGVADHVHLLFDLKPTHCLSDFMRELKKSSSVWISDNTSTPNFHWQEGYAAFTVSPSGIDAVRSYISRQEEHHRKTTFLDELTSFLEKSGVSYNPRYLD